MKTFARKATRIIAVLLLALIPLISSLQYTQKAYATTLYTDSFSTFDKSVWADFSGAPMTVSGGWIYGSGGVSTTLIQYRDVAVDCASFDFRKNAANGEETVALSLNSQVDFGGGPND